MSSMARSALRLRSLVGAQPVTSKLAGSSGSLVQQQSTRALWASTSSLSSRSSLSSSSPLSSSSLSSPRQSGLFTRHRQPCACRSCGYSTNAEKELVEFLAEEIVAEKKAQKLKTIPTEFEGFKVSLNGAEVTLAKKQGNEEVTIRFNVNHTVDMAQEPELDPQDDKPDVGEMKSKPEFNIDIKRGTQTLAFTCSFNNEPGASGENDEYNDIFGIDEISLYDGEHTDEVYAVGGEIIDGYLYDLLMNYLEEKGVSNEFAEKLTELSTSYEHTAYIGLLEGLSKFTKK